MAESKIFKAYIKEVRKIPFLTLQGQRSLITRYNEEGDMTAAFRLIRANLRLVVKIALEYQYHVMLNLMDLIQEGNAGLIQAVAEFSPNQGIDFSCFASYRIKANILKFIMDNRALVKIRINRPEKLFFNLGKEKSKLKRMGYFPGKSSQAATLNTDDENITKMEQLLVNWEDL